MQLLHTLLIYKTLEGISIQPIWSFITFCPYLGNNRGDFKISNGKSHFGICIPPEKKHTTLIYCSYFFLITSGTQFDRERIKKGVRTLENKNISRNSL